MNVKNKNGLAELTDSPFSIPILSAPFRSIPLLSCPFLSSPLLNIGHDNYSNSVLISLYKSLLFLALILLISGCTTTSEIEVTDTMTIKCPGKKPVFHCVELPEGPKPGKALADIYLDWEDVKLRDKCQLEWIEEWATEWDGCP